MYWPRKIVKDLFELLYLLYQTVPEIYCRLPFPHTTAHVSSDIHFWNYGTYETYVAGLLLPTDKTIFIYLAAYSKRITIQGYEFV